jgi:phosphate:Na+ symporter
MSHDERYERLKRAEGEIMLFYAGLHQKDQRAAQLVEAVRSAMYAAKGLRDVKHDRNELRNSVNEEKYARYLELRSYLEHFYAGLLPLFGNKDGEPRAQLALTLQQARTDYEKRMTELYGLAGKHDLVKADVPTLLNVNREFFSSAKAIIFALANYLLDEAGLEKFTDEIAEVPAW